MKELEVARRELVEKKKKTPSKDDNDTENLLATAREIWRNIDGDLQRNIDEK